MRRFMLFLITVLSAAVFLALPGNAKQPTPALEEQEPEGNTAMRIPVAPPIQCKGPGHTLVLDNGNVVARNVRWRIRSGQPGVPDQFGCGTAVPHKKQTGHFWFFNSEELDLSCKAFLRSGNAFYSVFCGDTNNVERWIHVINNGNPSIQKTYYSAPGKPISFADSSALPVGSNAVPKFGNINCNKTYGTPSTAGGSIGEYLSDVQGDDLTVTARVIQGDGHLQITPDWTNPITGTTPDKELWVPLVAVFTEAPIGEEYIILIEATDGKTLVKPSCTYRFIVR